MNKCFRKLGQSIITGLALFFLLSTTYSQNSITVFADSKDAQCGDTIVVPVKVIDFAKVVALDMSLVWNAAILEFTGNLLNLNQTIGLNSSNFGPYFPLDNDTLTFQWFNALGADLPDFSTLFALEFVVRGNGGKFGHIDFSNQYTPIVSGKLINNNIQQVPVDTINGVITILDQINPILVCPKDTVIVVPPNVNQLQVGNIHPNASDNCAIGSTIYSKSGATVGVGSGSASGTIFNKGKTQVNYTVSDYSGNTAACSFLVTIKDTLLHLFVINPDTVECDVDQFRVDVTARNFDSITSLQFALHWNDSQLDYLNVFNFHPSLSLNATNFGPTGGVTDTLTFSWFNPNGVTLPDDVILFSINFDIIGSPGTLSPITFVPTPSLPIEASKKQPSPGIPVKVGVQTHAGAVFITDTKAPTISCPPNRFIVIPQTTISTVVNGINFQAADNCGVPLVTYTISAPSTNAGVGNASGNTFFIGSSTVVYTATDQAGNTGTCSFTITVEEDSLVLIVNEPPVKCTDEKVIVCINAEGFNNLASLQFALQWDDTVLEFDTVISVNPLIGTGTYNFGPTNNQNQLNVSDTLTFSWFKSAGLGLFDGDFIFCVRFNLIGGVNTSTPINIVSTPSLPIEASVAQPQPQLPIVIPVYLKNSSVSITDDEPPIIENCPPDITLNTHIAFCSAVHQWEPIVATDNCTPDVTVVCNYNSPTDFPLGTTVVMCIATDEAGLSDTCSFSVTVVDNVPPVVNCQLVDIITVSDPDTCGTNVQWPLPQAVDNCTLNPTITGPAPGGFWEAGSHQILYTITDEAGNQSFCGFLLVIIDDTPPTILDCPTDFTITATTDTCTAVLQMPVPTFEDNCGVEDISFKIGLDFYTPTDFVVLPLGTHEVVWYIFDNFANLDSCTYLVTVDGGGDFVLTCPNDVNIILEAEECSELLDWNLPTFEGGCGNNTDLEIISDFSSPTEFAPGATTVVYWLINSITSDTLATCSFTVTLLEVTPPIFIDCPLEPINIVADSLLCGADFDYNFPVALDNCTDSIDIVYTVSGITPGFYPNGVYQVTYTAFDEFGNSANCPVTIIICDTIAPVISNCPNDIIVILPNHIDSCLAFVNWETPTVTDNCDSLVVLVGSHQPGEFGSGVRTVLYSATDNCGNVSFCSFTVSVLESFAPVISCPQNMVVNANGNIVSDPSDFITTVVVDTCKEVSVFFGLPLASDNCTFQPLVVQIGGIPSGDRFPVEDSPHIIVFQATDASGNATTCSATISVLPYTLQVFVDPNPVCVGDVVTLFTEQLGNATYTWTGPGQFTSNDPQPTIIIQSVTQAGTYSVSVKIGGCTNTLSGSVNLQIVTPPVLNDDNFEVIESDSLVNANIIINDNINFNFNSNITFITQPQVGILINNFDGTFKYVPPPGFTGTVEFLYEICYQECEYVCDQARVTIVIKPFNRSCKPNNLITPNNDDKNDVLVVACIEGDQLLKFPNNSLKIYNQWGDLVYNAKPYMNNWDGTYQGNSSSPLPDGTYYYVFLKGDGSDAITGFITLFR